MVAAVSKLTQRPGRGRGASGFAPRIKVDKHNRALKGASRITQYGALSISVSDAFVDHLRNGGRSLAITLAANQRCAKLQRMPIGIVKVYRFRWHPIMSDRTFNLDSFLS